MNVKFHKVTSYTGKFQNFTYVITILVKFDIHFLGLPWKFSLLLLQRIYYIFYTTTDWLRARYFSLI